MSEAQNTSNESLGHKAGDSAMNARSALLIGNVGTFFTAGLLARPEISANVADALNAHLPSLLHLSHVTTACGLLAASASAAVLGYSMARSPGREYAEQHKSFPSVANMKDYAQRLSRRLDSEPESTEPLLKRAATFAREHWLSGLGAIQGFGITKVGRACTGLAGCAAYQLFQSGQHGQAGIFAAATGVMAVAQVAAEWHRLHSMITKGAEVLQSTAVLRFLRETVPKTGQSVIKEVGDKTARIAAFCARFKPDADAKSVIASAEESKPVNVSPPPSRKPKGPTPGP